MNILVTGADGYIGTVLCDTLMEDGHTVTGLDAGFYRTEPLFEDAHKKPQMIWKDTRDVTIDDVRGFDAIIHLADLSNDPLGVLNPDNTYAINLHSTVRLAKFAKEAGVERFIFSSSCSIYGIATEDFVTEESETNPQTPYARCKQYVEQEVGDLADESFAPVFLRNATVYGASPNMRFDLVLNNLAGLAWTTKEIIMTSDGSPWRPIAHIEDVCQAMICAIKAPAEKIRNQVVNVGDNAGNYQVKDIASIVAGVFPGCRLAFGSLNGDTRSYRVKFDKIKALFPDFSCKHDAKSGAQQLRDIFEKIHMTKEQFESKNYTRIKQLDYLIEQNKLDEKFFWKAGAGAGL